MEILKKAMAGTMESSDIQIIIDSRKEKGIEIELKSSVEKQFGKQIRKVIKETVENLGVKSAKITAIDKGALDCTIKARVAAAVYRGAGRKENYDWEGMN